MTGRRRSAVSERRWRSVIRQGLADGGGDGLGGDGDEFLVARVYE